MKGIVSHIFLACAMLWIRASKGWLFTKAPNRVCYGTLGCFSGDYPFTNTPGILPRSPEAIGTKFLLFTRNSTHRYQELVITDKKKKCSWRSFCKKMETKFIIHGYMDSAEKVWVKKMVKALLKHGDYNVVVVDWRKGAREINYLQSASNIRVVGTQVAQLLTIIRQIYHIHPNLIHIIGHSLGAHAAGYAGEYLEGIGRITGLDPAGPAFEHKDTQVRLDPSDALFVDVIHTDGEHIFSLGFGLMSPVGHVDFYPNGGRDQTGCPTTYYAQMNLLFSGNFQFVQNFACSHLRVLDLFTESINSNCSFTSYPCDVIDSTSPQNCTSCDKGCGTMGYHVATSLKHGNYYLTTDDKSPFCRDNNTVI